VKIFKNKININLSVESEGSSFGNLKNETDNFIRINWDRSGNLFNFIIS
jgi:hypothetical protein